METSPGFKAVKQRRRLKAVLMLSVLCLAPFSGTDAGEGSGPSLINPLRKYHTFRTLRPFTSELKALVDKLVQEGSVTEAAVYFRSLNDGVWIGIDEKKRFAPASLMKVPIMMAYLKEAEKDPSLLDEKLDAETDSSHVQYIPSSQGLKKGEKYSVETLIENMICYSSNDAMLTLIRHVNVPGVLKMYDQLGYSGFKEEGDFISLKAYVGTFRVLYNATFLSEAMSEKALGYLVRTEFRKGIVASVPENVVVAHKFGEYGSPETEVKQLHDVGIVYHPDNPYLLGIMTRGRDYEKMTTAIETIAAFIYEEVDRQYKGGGPQDFPYKFEEEG